MQHHRCGNAPSVAGGLFVNVLIVEDEAIVAMDLMDIVESIGHTVVGPCHSAKTGEQFARTEAIDFAFLDINLGRGQTSENVAALLAQREIPFVFLSAYTRETVPFVGSHPILAKPYSEDMILSWLLRSEWSNTA